MKSGVLAVVNCSRPSPSTCVEPVTQSSIGICELPVELLTTILEHLDWKDVLRIRKVCKTLQEVSKTRSVWLNLCHPHLFPTATAPRSLYLERPIKLYTSHDLELLFLRLKSSDIGWKTDDKFPARRRQIVTTNIAKCMYLVEGGRWLLVVSVTGSITYFDLDASTPTESLLVPDQFDLPVPYRFRPKSEAKVAMAIDRDNDSAFLAFNLLVSFSSSRNYDPKAQVVQIWRVALSLDDQHQGIGLTAERLASFPLETCIGAVSCLSIHGPHVALSLISVDHEDCHLTFIIDWKQADGDQTDYPRRLVHPPDAREPAALHLLPGNKLITVAHDGVMVFDYLTVPETSSLPPFDFTDETIIPIWEERDLAYITGLRESSISSPFFCSHSIRFSIAKGKNMYGVIINYPYNEDPTEPLAEVVKLLGTVDFSHSYERYGYNKAAFCFGVTTCLLAYSWPDEQNPEPIAVPLEKEVNLGACYFGPFLDESSGRVIASADFAYEVKHGHDVWDFALIYK
ncbi:hypothetical protein M413DRAFT_448969 [Hebeloma cylindrosporum]|uniref:F-box domain-containing protein n=1 Tax=Hebeloma cylindrosporum TaxID=76867 RepID=A0A0C3BIV5_HEBCY|nr:hypothetical protein M413DRAFT_448969 [Hebeloma cylindrosporum h7]